MNTVDQDQPTTLDNVFFFLKTESERLKLPEWASLSVQNTGTESCRCTVYGTEPGQSYRWVHAAGTTTDEAAKAFHDQTNNKVVAAKKREEARKLLEEAAVIEAS